MLTKWFLLAAVTPINTSLAFGSTSRYVYLGSESVGAVASKPFTVTLSTEGASSVPFITSLYIFCSEPSCETTLTYLISSPVCKSKPETIWVTYPTLLGLLSYAFCLSFSMSVSSANSSDACTVTFVNLVVSGISTVHVSPLTSDDSLTA